MASLSSSTSNIADKAAPQSTSKAAKRTRRAFKPLSMSLDSREQGEEGKGEVIEREKLEGIVFDVDGTLCEPQNYMFRQMREVLKIPKSTDILLHLRSLPQDNNEQQKAWTQVRTIEREAMQKQTPQPGLTELMTYLREKNMRRGILTRNFEEPVNHLLSKFLRGHTFEPVLTRDWLPAKPDPAGVVHIAESWGVEARELKVDGEVERREEVLPVLMVGDSIDDMVAGRKAGAVTVLLANKENAELRENECTDVVIEKLDELIPRLEEGLETRW